MFPIYLSPPFSVQSSWLLFTSPCSIHSCFLTIFPVFCQPILKVLMFSYLFPAHSVLIFSNLCLVCFAYQSSCFIFVSFLYFVYFTCLCVFLFISHVFCQPVRVFSNYLSCVLSLCPVCSLTNFSSVQWTRNHVFLYKIISSVFCHQLACFLVISLVLW
jgi:hypothetical protein